ncbi:MAG: PAS domain S-box protein, partial [Candidatus Zixiibacteriota bacterium]
MQLSQTIEKLKDYDFLRTILSDLPAVVFVIAPDGTVLFAEGKGIAFAGHRRDDILGTNTSEYFSLYPGFEETMRRVLEGETITSTLIVPSQRSLEVTCSPLRDDRGSICGVVGVAQDISERIEQEQALRESEEKFRSITSAAIDAIIMMDQAGRISLWNDAAQAIFGYTEQEAIGQHLHFLFAPQTYNELTMIEGFASRGDGPLFGKVVELRARRRSGEEFPLELSLSAFRLHDKWQAVGTARDITERKKAEQQLRESEEKFSRAFQANAALMAITDT